MFFKTFLITYLDIDIMYFKALILASATDYSYAKTRHTCNTRTYKLIAYASHVTPYSCCCMNKYI